MSEISQSSEKISTVENVQQFCDNSKIGAMINSEISPKNGNERKKLNDTIIEMELPNGFATEKCQIPNENVRLYTNPQSVIVDMQLSGGPGYPQRINEDEAIPLDPDARNIFLKNVFTILFIMLAVSAAIILCAVLIPDVKIFYLRGPGRALVFFASFGIFALSYCMCCPQVYRIMPLNIIILVLTVMCYSILASFFTVFLRTETIFYAFLATAALVLICWMLASTSFDFTKWLIYFVGVTLVFFVLSICITVGCAVFGVPFKPFHIAMLFIGTLLNSVSLIMEIQMVLGGRAVEISEDDYYIAAEMLYTSIMRLLIHMLRLFSFLED